MVNGISALYQHQSCHAHVDHTTVWRRTQMFGNWIHDLVIIDCTQVLGESVTKVLFGFIYVQLVAT